MRLCQMLPTVVCAEHTARLNIIDDEDYEGVKRKVEEDLMERGIHVTEEYLEAGILALKQYYAVALLDPANSHAISAELDPFWHMHILHSEQYIPFCDKVVGRYMHHVPLDHRNTIEVSEVRDLYTYTVDTLKELFGGNVDERRFWPRNIPDTKLVCRHAKDYPTVHPFRLFEERVLVA